MHLDAEAGGSTRPPPASCSPLARWRTLVPRRRSLHLWLLYAAMAMLVSLSFLAGRQQVQHDDRYRGGNENQERHAVLVPDGVPSSASPPATSPNHDGDSVTSLQPPQQQKQLLQPPLRSPPLPPRRKKLPTFADDLSEDASYGSSNGHEREDDPASALQRVSATPPVHSIKGSGNITAVRQGRNTAEVFNASAVNTASESHKELHHHLLYTQHGHARDHQEEDVAIYHKAKSNLQRNGYLILAVASNGNLEFALNWIASLGRTGHSRYLLMCLDELICSRLDPSHAALVPRHWLQRDIDTNPLLYGTIEYINLVQSKTMVVIPFLRMGFTVLFSDVDIVWLSPWIIPYLQFIMTDNPYCEAVFSLDQTADTVPSVNTGFWIAKPAPAIMEVFHQTVEIQMKRNVTQQSAFNAALRMARLKTSPKIAFLDKTLFPNGRVYFKYKLTERTGVKPFIVHANYLRGVETKRQHLREAGLWLLDDVNTTSFEV